MIYPRSKIGLKSIVLILVAILVVAGSFVIAERRNSSNKKIVYTSSVTPRENSLKADLQEVDSDTDGLKDWEEVLLGTDPHNPDTDKDGTSDGKEVTLERNPLIKGPNDSAKATASTGVTTKENLTETDKLARDFFARYMELRQVGLSKDKLSQQELVGTVLKNGIVMAKPKTYTDRDIIVIEDISTDAVKRYGNDVGLIFNKYPTTGRDAPIVAKESLTKEDPDILKELDPDIKAFRNIIRDLLKVKTPRSISVLHTNLIGAMEKFLFVYESLRNGGVDALKSLQGASMHLEAGKSLIDSLQALKNNLVSLNITYSSNEPGMLFFK